MYRINRIRFKIKFVLPIQRFDKGLSEKKNFVPLIRMRRNW